MVALLIRERASSGSAVVIGSAVPVVWHFRACSQAQKRFGVTVGGSARLAMQSGHADVRGPGGGRGDSPLPAAGGATRAPGR